MSVQFLKGKGRGDVKIGRNIGNEIYPNFAKICVSVKESFLTEFRVAWKKTMTFIFTQGLEQKLLLEGTI